jgi:CubicO group peptidase (beta-lactamase class C family)
LTTSIREYRFASAARVISQAVEARAFPAAVTEVGDVARPRWREAFGHLTFEADASAAREDAIFDLASLTKVLATVPLAIQQVERGAIALDYEVASYFERWRGGDRSTVTLRDLLAHCSGLSSWAPLFREYKGREEFVRAICDMPLEYVPRTRSLYSDLGFILLGFVLAGEGTLEARFDALRAQMGVVEDMQYLPPSLWHRRTAPTEIDPWRERLLVGEVHDENAYALGGVAGHAGLFGTAAAVGQHARHLLQILDGRIGALRRESLETFIARRTDIPHSSRALGWDTMLPSSSCGSRMSPRAFGHTGFTGTSLWIDPDRGVYVVLLTNRVHPSRANDAIQHVRPAFHDAVMAALG